ncbi:MAG: VOC family protein [Actinomycetota bacterium]|nr:VOC family protein [Actinomycetota bacterium]
MSALFEAREDPPRRMRLNVTLDCNDLKIVAAFWGAVLGCVEQPTVPDRYTSLTPPGRDFTITLQRVEEPKRGKNRMHLDVLIDDLDAEVARIEALGGRRVTPLLEDFGERWFVMADPEGNEFCLAELPHGP